MLKLKWRIKLWWRKLFGKTPPAMPHYIYESKNTSHIPGPPTGSQKHSSTDTERFTGD